MFSGVLTASPITRARCGMLLFAAFFLACASYARAQAPAGASVVQDRLDAVDAAVRSRDAKAASALIANFSSEPTPAVRAALVRGVARLDGSRGGALARVALLDSQPFVRMAAAEALVQSQGDGAVGDLIAALGSETNDGVRHAIVGWLGGFKTAAARMALQQAISSDPNPNVRLQAARSLKRQGTPAARTALDTAKLDSDVRVRKIANEP